MTSQNKAIRFRFQRSASLGIAPATGAWATAGSQGRIVCDFFYERPHPVVAVEHALNQNGTVGPEIAREISDAVVREITASVEMSAETAVEIANCLLALVASLGSTSAETGAGPAGGGEVQVH